MRKEVEKTAHEFKRETKKTKKKNRKPKNREYSKREINPNNILRL